ncbi:hypothetical protein MRBLMG1_004134, partial [Streptomyces sp. LMG1-1-1.1]
MFGKWRGRKSHGAEAGAPVEGAAPAAPAAAPGDAWRGLPPVQRVLDAPRTIAEHGFSTSLATHWNPSFQSDLGHGALPDAPAGVLLDAVRPVLGSGTGPAGGELPGLRLPVARAAGSAADPAPLPDDAAGTAPEGPRAGGGQAVQR